MSLCDIPSYVVNSSSSVVSRQIIMISSSSQIDRFICMSVCVHVFCVKLFDGFCVDLSQSFDVVWLHSSTRHTTTSSTSSSFFGLEPSSCNLFAFSSLRLAFAAVVNVRPIVRSQKLATHCTFSHAILAFNHGQACVSLPLAVKSCSFEI